MGREKEAIEMFIKAIDFYHGLDNNPELFGIYYNLGHAYIDIKNMKKQKRFSERL